MTSSVQVKRRKNGMPAQSYDNDFIERNKE